MRTVEKVLEKLLINRIMYHMYSKDVLNRSQYGFTPQTSTTDVIMAVRNHIEESMKEGYLVAMISLDVKGAFDAAWWPGILNSLREYQCPKNLYNLVRSYFSDRCAILTANTVRIQKSVKGAHKALAVDPGYGTSNTTLYST